MVFRTIHAREDVEKEVVVKFVISDAGVLQNASMRNQGDRIAKGTVKEWRFNGNALSAGVWFLFRCKDRFVFIFKPTSYFFFGKNQDLAKIRRKLPKQIENYCPIMYT